MTPVAARTARNGAVDDPVAHAEASAAAIPGARLVRLAGTGHELHEATWPAIVEAIARHTHGRG